MPSTTFTRTTTVTVRPMTHADVAQLAAGETLQGYKAHTDGLTPVTIRARTRYQHGGPIRTRPVGAVRLIIRPNSDGAARGHDVQNPVGNAVAVTVADTFGSESGGTLYTTPEAEDAVDEVGARSFDAAELREQLYLADPEGTPLATVPVYGAQVTLTVFVPNVDHVEALAAAQRALDTAFGGAGRVASGRSRPVHDRRVNVSDLRDGEYRVVGVNVLAAEASYVPGVNGVFRTEPSEVFVGQ